MRGFVAAAALAALLTAAVGRGDEVRIKSRKLPIRGTILHYDERGISIQDQVNKNRLHEIAPDEIESVSVAGFGDEVEEAEKAFESGKFAKAIELYGGLIDTEKLNWAKARFRGQLVMAYRRTRKHDRAGEEFLKLAETRNDAELMNLAPLLWIPGDSVGPAAVASARQWLNDERRPMARLLAASWLLDTSEKSTAMPVLQRLQTYADERIGKIARAQLWRVAAQKNSKAEIEQFKTLIGKMPPAIRGGPQYLLGLALERANEPADAALAYLWVPLVYDRRSDLAADALLRGAMAADKAGFTNDARKLYQEVGERFPRTRWASEAARKLPSAKATK